MEKVGAPSDESNQKAVEAKCGGPCSICCCCRCYVFLLLLLLFLIVVVVALVVVVVVVCCISNSTAFIINSVEGGHSHFRL